MAIALPRKFVEVMLLGPTNDRRQLQDSPILGDVWLRFAADPESPQELLITPHREKSAGEAAVAIDDKIVRQKGQPGAEIAPLHTVVAARLYFREVLGVVIPLTGWWHDKRVQTELRAFLNRASGAKRLRRVINAIVDVANNWKPDFEGPFTKELLPGFDRYLALAGLILWAGKQDPPAKPGTTTAPAPGGSSPTPPQPLKDEELTSVLREVDPDEIGDLLRELLKTIPAPGKGEKLVWQISLNRKAMPALHRSVPAVKADAARTLFSVDCSAIAWAVIDAGIEGSHAAFKDAKGKTRIRQSFDFSNIRKIVSLDNRKLRANDDLRKERLRELLHRDLVNRPDEATALDNLERLAKDAELKRPTHWDLVRPFVEIKPATRPAASDHGTHVAGIIGASTAGLVKAKVPAADREDYVDGMCPDIQLYDFRVLSADMAQTEFAIIAVLQYIRDLNSRTDYISIHGANLSLSIPHDVRNYACGRTPICLECERLVESGVVVVAAAGNLGYQSFTTRDGSYEGYAAFSVTDPGNADGVITVGATHRYSPHTYGVSFFSSRGPTGDGRPKPDLVAPGERIRAPFREGWGDLDGTSMAAPHVSGAAAMLMARYSELIGQPRRIKQLLCESATDLGRERSFQGNGMLDVLRAFQRT